MNIRKNWLKCVGAVDYVFTGLTKDLGDNVAKVGIASAIGGIVFTIAATITAQNYAQDFSEDLDTGDLAVQDGGAQFGFPEDCGVGEGYYLFSKNPNGGYELSYSYSNEWSNVRSEQDQKKMLDNANECMDTIKGWAKKNNYKFADEFSYLADVEYTDVGLVYETDTKVSSLYKDVIGDDIETMSEVIKEYDEYDVSGSNIKLYKAEFNKAVEAWDYYTDRFNPDVEYYDSDGNIKYANQYARYEYDDQFNSSSWFFYSCLAGGLMLCGIGLSSSTYRGAGYYERKEKRDQRIAELSVMDGRSGPLM
ncbi:MAG: hypothetical protein CL561_03745 [Alphaproteobacteria bacterium]|nr:hypothetical protein [Alphaproteobacteria bacterium]|tara:strand:+ start:974 stop:1894 length:921 start_codon:yes stop_codon:yes gene_type:complete